MAPGGGGYSVVVTEYSPEEAETYHDYSVDDEDQPSNVDDLGDPDVDDALDRGYSPPEKWSRTARASAGSNSP